MNKDELIVRQVAIKGAIELVIADKDNGTDMFELAQSIQDWVLEPFESENVSQQKPFSETVQPPEKKHDLTCPICSSKVFDNRGNKLKETQPNFKCGNKQCEGDGKGYPYASWSDDIPAELINSVNIVEPKAIEPKDDLTAPF
tara:strand:+ start:793 stop:1221 length:429 start_codon:yes stop_codon:yes gene_type:complete